MCHRSGLKVLSTPDAIAALCFRIFSGVSSDHRAVRCVLFNVDADIGRNELWAFVHVTDSNIYGDDVPSGSGAIEIGLITRHNLKVYITVFLIIQTLQKKKRGGGVHELSICDLGHGFPKYVVLSLIIIIISLNVTYSHLPHTGVPRLFWGQFQF